MIRDVDLRAESTLGQLAYSERCQERHRQQDLGKQVMTETSKTSQ